MRSIWDIKEELLDKSFAKKKFENEIEQYLG